MHSFGLRVAAPVCLSLLAACGGGGTSPTSPTVIPSFTAASADSAVALAAVSLDSGARSTSGLSGTLDLNDNTYTVGTLSGDISANRTLVNLSDGGNVVIGSGATDFAVLFEATPIDGNRTIGIVGGITPTADLPSGTADYTGDSAITLRDGASVYELTGTATIAADFANGTVTTTATNLDGTERTGLTAPVNVSDVASVTFTGSRISGATFDGGTPDITSSNLTALGDNPDSSLNGAFFGTAADEAGATFVIDDTDDSGVIAFGTLIAD